MIHKIKVKTYDGSLKSVKDIVKDLKLEPFDYSYDVINKRLLIHTRGILYQPGDCYQTMMKPEEFKVL